MQFIDEIVLPVMGFTVLVVVLFVVLFAALVGGAAALEAYQCVKYESVTGKPTRYEGLSCYVQDTGNWYAWTEYQHRLATKGEFSK